MESQAQYACDDSGLGSSNSISKVIKYPLLTTLLTLNYKTIQIIFKIKRK
jgi:hypothetical protein